MRAPRAGARRMAAEGGVVSDGSRFEKALLGGAVGFVFLVGGLLTLWAVLPEGEEDEEPVGLRGAAFDSGTFELRSGARAAYLYSHHDGEGRVVELLVEDKREEESLGIPVPGLQVASVLFVSASVDGYDCGDLAMACTELGAALGRGAKPTCSVMVPRPEACATASGSTFSPGVYSVQVDEAVRAYGCVTHGGGERWVGEPGFDLPFQFPPHADVRFASTEDVDAKLCSCANEGAFVSEAAKALKTDAPEVSAWTSTSRKPLADHCSGVGDQLDAFWPAIEGIGLGSAVADDAALAQALRALEGGEGGPLVERWLEALRTSRLTAPNFDAGTFEIRDLGGTARGYVFRLADTDTELVLTPADGSYSVPLDPANFAHDDVAGFDFHRVAKGVSGKGKTPQQVCDTLVSKASERVGGSLDGWALHFATSTVGESCPTASTQPSLFKPGAYEIQNHSGGTRGYTWLNPNYTGCAGGTSYAQQYYVMKLFLATAIDPAVGEKVRLVAHDLEDFVGPDVDAFCCTDGEPLGNFKDEVDERTVGLLHDKFVQFTVSTSCP